NELGNLYLHKNKYDSAAYHFDFASDLTPAWAIPWSNKIRMSIMQKRWTKAKEAFVKADSLQPNLSYVLMNGGLVMEQEKDWLAAESYYLKSIEFNDVHFFPYERLAGIYLHTGAYLNADYFFSLAKTRKENFSLNDTYFKFGIELGGQVAFDEVQPHPDRSRLAFMESTAQKIPGNPLLEHYMGEHFYKTGLWEKAERALLKAVDQYLDSNALRTRLQSLVSAHAKLKHDTSLVSILMGYQYDKLEDHYLLAGLYERKGFYEQAIEQYKIIESIENRRQMTQATFGGLPFSFEPDPSNLSKIEDVVKRYEATHKMTGVIKLARLYERLGRLSLAEETLLNQVKRNRAAGLERQQVMNTGKTNLYWKALGYKINFYYLNINRNLEVETFNFYDRITKMLPRDYEWKEKAGMFLYNRLLLAYERMPVEEYPSFTESIERYDYPWTGKGDVVPREETITLNAPGTAEEITIKVTLYHPVFVALEYLKQSVKLYGDEQPRGEILTAITNLYSWSGAFDTAIHLLSKQVAEQPGDASLRNKLIDILMYNGAFPQARQHLDTLYNNEQLRKDQLIELVGYHLLTGNHKHAAKLLNEYKPENELENLALLSKKALMNFIQGKQENALKYLVDSFPVIRMKNDFENGVYNDGIYLENEKKKEFQIFQFYLTARLYALLQKDDKAFLTLKAALDSGFVYKNVLDNDAVWKRLKTSSKWENLISKYNFIVTDAEPSGIERSPLEYILPPSGNKYSY
ncbi:MAG TPA: tetratricopeptide repeat protein, partial [Segetibacter sp.]